MFPLLSLASVLVLLSLKAVAATSIDNKTYEYIVVGSGPGGGPLASNLARAGHSVLLIEAGDDQTENGR
jgi:choline dehydrogenase